MSLDTERQIAKYLESFNSEIAHLAQRLRGHIKDKTTPAIELVGDSTISLNIGYGFTEKAWDCFCAIIVYSKHINISFPAGAFLSDPHGLLRGSGKKIRHIRIDDFSDIESPAVMELLMVARKRAVDLVGDTPAGKYPVETIVREIAGTKKRSK